MRIFLSIVFFLSASSLFGQDFWRGTLITSFSGPVDTVYALANNSIYRLENNGQQWVKTGDLPLIQYSVKKVQIDSDGRLWQTDWDGTIKVSENGGASWVDLPKSPATYVVDFKLMSGYMFSIAPGKVYRKTISAGAWETVYDGAAFQDFTMNARGDMFISFYEFKILMKKSGEANWVETKLQKQMGGDSTGMGMGGVSSPDRLVSVGNRVLVGTYWDRVWYRDADAAAWSQSAGEIVDCPTCPFSGVGIKDFVVKNNNEIYALAKDQLNTHGWAKSNDGGLTFSLMPFNQNNWVRIKTSQLVVQGNNLYMNTGEWGFLFSGDNGITWTPINNGIDNVKPHHVARLTEDKNGKWWALMTIGHFGAGPGTSWGVLTSINQGVTWQQADQTLNDQYNTLEDLLVSGDGNAYVTGYLPGKFHKSPLGAASWSKLDFRMEGANPDSMMMGGISTAFKLEESGDRIYAATYWNNIVMTVDGGAEWKELELSEHAGVLDFDVQGNTIYALSADQLANRGLYKSIDYGTSWASLNSLTSRSFRKIHRYDTMLFAATYDSMFRSNDDGAHWIATQPTYPGINQITFLRVLPLPVSSGDIGTTYPYLLIGTNKGLFATQAGFNEWKKITDGYVFSISEITSTDHILIGYEHGYRAIKTNEILNYKNSQSVAIEPFGTHSYNDEPFPINASATSGLPLTFTSSNPNVATISGNSITITGVGTSVISAFQAGDEENHPAVATQDLAVGKDDHFINFTLRDSVNLFQGTLTLEAFVVASTPVTFTLEGPGSISGNVLTMDSTGNYTITAHNEGDSLYLPAEPVTKVLVVYDGRAEQMITFSLADSVNLFEGTLTLDASALASTPVTFTLEGPGTIEGNLLTMDSTGNYTITAHNEGDILFLPAEPVSRVLVVHDGRVQQTITFSVADSLFVDESPYTLEATSSSNLPVTFEVVSGSGTITDNSLFFSTDGLIAVRAIQPGNNNFKPAQTVVRSIVIKPMNTVSGTVSGPNNETVQGLVRALTPEGEVTAEVAITNNTFSFTTHHSGLHYLLFVPSTDAYYPSYYDSALTWDEAEAININGTLTINWQATPKEEDVLSGNATILGLVVSDGSGGRTTTVVHGRTKTGTPMKDVPVRLLEANSAKIITSAVSDANGEFRMEKIPAGNYRLAVDVVGARMDQASSQIVVGDDETLELTSVVGENSIETTMKVVMGIESEEACAWLKVYPNPATSHLYIEANPPAGESYQVLFFNSLGSLMTSMNPAGVNVIDLSSMTQGLYLLQVRNKRGETERVVKVVLN